MATGHCLSAAITIFLAASLRLASPDTVFLLHQTSRTKDSLPDLATASSLQAVADELRASDMKFAQLLADRTGGRIDCFLDEIATEDGMDVTEAISSGLVHSIEGDELNPYWSDLARVPVPGIYCPPRVMTENFFDACRCAGSLHRKNGAKS
jgi:ATP-dependent protease ClpP protease subunit